MKKLLLFIVITVFIMSPTFSQDDGGTSTQGISFGVKAGVNFASLSGDDADEEELDGRTSIHAGGVVNIPVSEFFAVQPEVIYSAQGFTFTDEVDVTGKLDYIIIPVLADFTIAEGFSLQGGPQVGFNVTNEFESDDGTEEIPDVESIDFAAAIGAQFRLPIGLFFQARFVVGLTNINSGNDDFDAKNSVVSISTGWFFN